MLKHRSGDTSEVGRHGQIPTFVQFFFVESRPIAVDFSAADRPPHDPHRVAVAMIGTAVAVFPRSATEFGDHEHDRTPVNVAKSRVELRKPVTQRLQVICQLSFRTAFPDVRVPTAETEEGELNCRVLTHQLAQFRRVIGKSLR